MKPGELLKEGVVVLHDPERGVMVGREAEPGELCPARHTEHNVPRWVKGRKDPAGTRRVFLSDAQAPIPPAGLHKRAG